MKKSFTITAITLLFILFGCKDERTSLIEEYISNIDGTVTDINFKLISITDLSPVYVIDSVNIINEQYNVQDTWRNLDSINAQITEYLNDKYPGPRVREYYEWVIPIFERLRNYYELPQEKILAQRSVCVYSINNPFLNNVKQTITDTVYFSEDYSRVLDKE